MSRPGREQHTYGSVPVGDNAGAFARGFTTGPDATAVTFNSTTGQAVVSFDQRVDLVTAMPDPAGFVLLDANGSPGRRGSREPESPPFPPQPDQCS